MSPIERMVGNLTKRCSHSQPVYQPCDSCTAARLNQITKIYKSELHVAIGEEHVTIKNRLKEALSSIQKMVDEGTELRRKIAKLEQTKTDIIATVRDRDRQIGGLNVQLRAERGSKLKVLDLSEVEV